MKKTVVVTCANCGKDKHVPAAEFNRSRYKEDKKWFCNSKCAAQHKHNNSLVTTECPVCGTSFTRRKCDISKCCSTSCANILRFSDEEERIKISLANRPGASREDLHFCAYCGKFIKSSRKAYCSIKCTTAAHWRDVFNTIKETGSFPVSTHGETDRRVAKKFLVETVGNKCAICGRDDCKLVVDHINGDACDSSVNNLRLLCEDCDRASDTYKNKPHKANRPWRRKGYKSQISA